MGPPETIFSRKSLFGNSWDPPFPSAVHKFIKNQAKVGNSWDPLETFFWQYSLFGNSWGRQLVGPGVYLVLVLGGAVGAIVVLVMMVVPVDGIGGAGAFYNI